MVSSFLLLIGIWGSKKLENFFDFRFLTRFRDFLRIFKGLRAFFSFLRRFFDAFFVYVAQFHSLISTFFWKGGLLTFRFVCCIMQVSSGSDVRSLGEKRGGSSVGKEE